MRRWVLAPVVLLPLSLLGVPGAAAAPPESGAELCAADPVRGAVPATFPLRACVDGTGMTLHNDGARPVVVRPLGDVGTPVRVRSQNDAVSAVLRLTAGGPEVLLPGEVTRWSIGADAASLTVEPLPVPAAPEMADRLRPVLDGVREEPAAGTLRTSVAALIGDVATALQDREECAVGRNFLGTTACDVAAAAAIGAATATRLDGATGGDVLPPLLDAGAWAEWSAIDPGGPDANEATLHQLAVPPPPPPPAPEPAPAPVRPRPAPAPPPAPAPAPPPAVAPPPAPALPPRHVVRVPTLQDWVDWYLQQRARDDRSRDDDRGRGHGRGRGNGR